jgi:hypothetical protein
MAGQYRRRDDVEVLDRLSQRFAIARVCGVADRGMISAETMAEAATVYPGRARAHRQAVGELWLVQALVPQLAVEASAAIIRRRRRTPPIAPRSSLRWSASSPRGDKALVSYTGYRRYLKTISDDHLAIDRDKVEKDKRLDGVFVLRTNTDLNPLEAMLRYKQLWTVEQTFRTAKHLFATRPIFHKLDETHPRPCVSSRWC